MEDSDIDVLRGQLQAMTQVLVALIDALDALPAAKVAMNLAMEAESLRMAANRSAPDDVALQVITAFRDRAHSAH